MSLIIVYSTTLPIGYARPRSQSHNQLYTCSRVSSFFNSKLIQLLLPLINSQSNARTICCAVFRKRLIDRHIGHFVHPIPFPRRKLRHNKISNLNSSDACERFTFACASDGDDRSSSKEPKGTVMNAKLIASVRTEKKSILQGSVTNSIAY